MRGGQVLVADAELERMVQLQITFEGYVERVQTAAAILEQASTALKAQLEADCTDFAAACRQCRGDLQQSAPYDGQVQPCRAVQLTPAVQLLSLLGVVRQGVLRLVEHQPQKSAVGARGSCLWEPVHGKIAGACTRQWLNAPCHGNAECAQGL